MGWSLAMKNKWGKQSKTLEISIGTASISIPSPRDFLHF